MSTYSAHGLIQPGLPGLCGVEVAVDKLSTSDDQQRGAVFTRREVVDFILDLSGYTVDAPLCQLRLLEPSFGNGDFLLPIIERLLDHRENKLGGVDPMSLSSCIQAVELHKETFEKTRRRIVEYLASRLKSSLHAESLANKWLIQGDFLLTELAEPFNIVVGNPPYVRQDMVPDILMEAYRARYKTIYDRADLYIPFIERSLIALAQDGCLSFICADRWVKNRYGGRLRKLVSDRFRLKIYVDMVGTQAFQSEVSAYPSIFVISREKPGPTRISSRPSLEPSSLRLLSSALKCSDSSCQSLGIREVNAVTQGDAAWVLNDNDQLPLLRRLEATYPTLEQAGCKVGIGVATGADQAFIGDYALLDVEPDRKLPLAMTRDIQTGVVIWQGLGVINPFSDDGRLVDLEQYPKLRKYLEDRKEVISSRHVAMKSKQKWYRTIDRIYPDLTSKPKLLIPDIKGNAHIVFDEGKFYPHHNLYFVTSDTWDMRALQAVLLSSITRLFIGNYSTTMRGGYLRYQAQYLRKIRIPHWNTLSQSLRNRLSEVCLSQNIALCDQVIAELYCLSQDEVRLLQSTKDVHGARSS